MPKIEKTTKEVKAVKAKPVTKVIKPVAKKAVAKPAAKIVAVKKETVKADAVLEVTKVAAKETPNKAVSVDVCDIEGKITGKLSLPAEIFGETVNQKLLSQTVRVYLANQRQGNASTKTRGEVDGSTRKIYRQKGTGRARHGSLRAPIFVKGGIVFGPKPRDFSLSLPQKMKRKALFSALSAKAQDSQVTVLTAFDEIKPKTKAFAAMLTSLKITDKKPKYLFVTADTGTNAKRGGQNIPGVTFTEVRQLHAYAVLNTKTLVLDKKAIEEMKKLYLGKDK